MWRIYCFIDPDQKYRYYRTKSGIWSMWSYAAQPLKYTEARELAQSENAFFERI
jgi:hypothetical protein